MIAPALKLAVVVGALWVLLADERLELAAFELRDGAGLWIMAAIAAVLAQMLLMQLRFWLVLQASNVRASVARVVKVGLASWFLNASLLGGFGFLSNDIVRAAYLFQDSRDRLVVAGSVVVDRVIGLIGLLLIVICGSGAAFAATRANGLAVVAIVAALGISGLAAGAAILGFSRVSSLPRPLRESKMVDSLSGALGRMFASNEWPKAAVLGVAAAVLGQCLAIAGMFALSRALAPPDPTVAALAVAAPAAFLTAVAPLPANGLGVGELAFDTVLRLVSDPAAPLVAGAALFLAFRLLSMALALVGLPAFLSLRLSGGSRR